MLPDPDLMNIKYDPYCRLCKYKFEWGDSAIDHFLKEHYTLCWELHDFRQFTDVVMSRFMSNTKIDEEEKKDD